MLSIIGLITTLLVIVLLMGFLILFLGISEELFQDITGKYPWAWADRYFYSVDLWKNKPARLVAETAMNILLIPLSVIIAVVTLVVISAISVLVTLGGLAVALYAGTDWMLSCTGVKTFFAWVRRQGATRSYLSC